MIAAAEADVTDRLSSPFSCPPTPAPA